MLRTLLSAAAFTVFVVASPAMAKDYIIGLSPNLPNAKDTVTETMKLVISEMDTGDTAMFIDAYHNKTLATFDIPEGDAYHHQRVRFTANLPAIKALREFTASPDTERAQGEIRLPEFLRFIGGNYPSAAPMDILIFGDMNYRAQGAFATADGRVPGDGHLSRSTKDTPFGIDHNGQLNNMRIHLRLPSVPASDENHHWHMRRFYSLMIEKMGGQLVTVTADLPTLFSRIKRGDRAPVHDYNIMPGDKLEMIRLTPPDIQSSALDPAALFTASVSATPLSLEALSSVKDAQIGIKWHSCAACDLDLYVKPHARAETLFFQQTRSIEGVYRKDFRSAPVGGLESVDLSGTFDGNAIRIAVNFYSGDSGDQPVTGEIRARIDNNIYVKSFTIPATSGNRGANAHRIFNGSSAPSDHWVRFSLADIVQQ